MSSPAYPLPIHCPPTPQKKTVADTQQELNLVAPLLFLPPSARCLLSASGRFLLHVLLVLPLPMQSPLGLLEDFTASPSSLGECVLHLFPCACSLYRLSDRQRSHGLKNYTGAPKSVSSALACLVHFLSIYLSSPPRCAVGFSDRTPSPMSTWTFSIRPRLQ